MIAVPRILTQLAIFALVSKAEGDRLPQTIEDGAWPRVDVFVTYCGEDLKTITNTVKAACSVDYPKGLIRIIVLDDSDCSILATAIRRLGRDYPNILYASRKVRVTTHSKAANLNFGLRYVGSLKGGRPDYVAVLDVDMIPEPDWLRRVLPYVHNNPRVALACPFQRFYNIPAGDPLKLKTELGPMECIIYLQDFADDSWCTGSGFVVRTEALDSIGGFPELLLQEDVLTSNCLSTAGWQSIYVPSPVQWGLAPDTFAGCLKQCRRWTVGILSFSHFMMTEDTGKFSLEARLNGIVWGVVPGSGAFVWTFAFLTLPILALTGQPLVVADTARQLRMLSRLVTLDFAAQSFFNILLAALLDYRLSFDNQLTAVWTQPWKVMVALRYFVIPKILGYPILNFTTTGTPEDGKAELAARNQKSRIILSKIIFWDHFAFPHLVIFLCCVAGAGIWVRTGIQTFHGAGAYEAAHQLLLGIAWPHVLFLWITLAKAAWVPVAYALRPVAIPGRHQFLTPDQTNDVEYPSEQVKQEYMRKSTRSFDLLKFFFYIAAALFAEALYVS